MFIQNEYIKMAVINSYYLYQKYEKRGNQPWIPSYPNTWSIDGDGTMPPVLKQQDDPSCYHPIYRWVQTEDTICIDTTSIDVRTTSGTPYCDGYDKYVDTTTEQSFDGGITWEFVSSASTLVEQDSEYCGYHPTPEVQYRWTESGTTCDNANKYKRYIKEVSYDGGYAWIVVTPPQYSAGTLVEQDSYDCGYRTSATTSATYCSNANQYVDVYSLVSRDYGETWTTASTSTELIEEDVVECGFSARTISTATTCVGVDKHYLDEYQESRNSGTTWTTISSSTGSLIEAKSADCGYAERTISGTPYCDGADLVVVTSAQTSSDSGSTWTTVSTAITMVESGSSQCHQTIHVTGVTLNKNSMSLNSGSSETLVATVSPSNADDKSVTWSSNNTSVATVNSSGLVSAVTSGSATITVTTTDGGYTAQCSVSVTAEAHDYSQDYLTIEMPLGGNLKFVKRSKSSSDLSYSTDNGSTWTTLPSDTYIFINGSAIFKGELSPSWGGNDGIGTFETSGNSAYFEVKGNPMSLLSRNFQTKKTFSSKSEFYGLFRDCTYLTSALNLSLPASALTSNCYRAMFARCTSLTTAPKIIDATSVNNSSCALMFTSCTSLTTAPELPATTLANGCYSSMFEGCTSLTTAPELPATTLADSCYHSMFRGCTSLTTAPSVLSATTLGNYCYYGMFQGCTSLTTAPELPATTLTNQCYDSMFFNCTSLTTAPELPATTLVNQCYAQLFNGCANLNSITCLATDISASYCTYNWVAGVAASGTFTKAASMNDWATGISGIPSGWTVQDYSN